MNMQAQLMIDQYLLANKECLQNELLQNGFLTEDGPCAEVINHFAEEDAQELHRVLQKDERVTLGELIRFHHNKPTARTIVYWVTFYLSISRGQNSGWALRCATHSDTLHIYCKALDNLL